MNAVTKLVLLPGMDGTGDLFADFIKELPHHLASETIRYPVDRYLSISELAEFVESANRDPTPFVLVAESFSTPIAIEYAARNARDLRGLVICAGFITSPIRGWLRYALFPLKMFFSLPLPGFLLKKFLIGPTAQPALLNAVQTAISSVQPEVLSDRANAILDCDVRADLAKVTVPILYIQAKQDRLVSAQCLDDIKQIKPTIVAKSINAPHLLLQREPRLAAYIIASFIQTLS